MCKYRSDFSPVFFLLVLTPVLAVNIDPNCDYYQELQLGQEYYIYNKEYPNGYPYGTACRWTGKSPPGTVIVLSCNDVTLPNSAECQGDRLSFSPSGDEHFSDGENYCGSTTFTAYTSSNNMAVGLFGNRGGRFLCSLAAMRVEQNCNCGNHMQTRIVGGQDAGVNEFPSMSVLIDATTYNAFCGATIISPRYALTASHCLQRQVPSNVGLLVGDHDLSTGDDTDAAALYAVQDFLIHPLYNSTGEQNDIALVKTRYSIAFSLAVGRVCLPFNYREYNFAGEKVTALGWGYKDFSGDKSDILQKVDLDVITNSQCSVKERVDVTQICTYTPGKDSCLSDSGGPLLWKDFWSGKLELVAIISYGVGCATNTPAVNTRVTSYLSWIASVTPDASYCIQ